MGALTNVTLLYFVLVGCFNLFADELFIPFGNTVPLGVGNITQFSAKLHWNLPVETRERLKAMRVG
jgi:hypothetical protein